MTMPDSLFQKWGRRFVIALMFAPVSYPADRLPGWLSAIHEWLPFTYMARTIRETVLVPPSGVSVTPFLVLALWCAAGLGIAYRVMSRRA